MRFDSKTRLVAVVGIVTFGFVVVDLVLANTSKVSLATESYFEFAKVMAVLGALYWILMIVDRRISGDNNRIARLIAGGSDGVKALILNGGLFIPLGFVSVYFMYMAAATSHPLMDETLAVIDYRIGFNWRSFLELTNSQPIVAKVLAFAYHSLGPQLPLLFLVLALWDRPRLTEFMAILAVSSALTAALMAIVPAAGAYAFYQPIPADFSNFTARAGSWHVDELARLRAGEPFSLLVTRAEGLVTFPSYHTALGIMVVYALRTIHAIAWPVGILNAVMIVSTIPEGGHYLIDVIAGVVVAIASILVVRVVQKGFILFRLRGDSYAATTD